MNRLELFRKLIEKAKAGGYKGKDYKFETGHILDETNIYSVIFREDFIKSIWGEDGSFIIASGLLVAKDKWKFLEENVKFED